MKRFLILFTALVFSTCPLFGQATAGFHRVNQVLARAYSGVGAEIVPNATIAVTNTATGQAATIYFDPTLLSPISPSVVYANDQGNYSYYMALGNCVTETITSPGMSTITIPNICSNTAGSGVVGFGTTQQAAIYTSSGNSVTGGTLSLGGGGTAATTAAGAVQNIVNNQNILPATVKANTVTASVNTQINVAGPPYNARGDCSTDDNAAITAALRAADTYAVGSSGPATVYFPKPPGGCYLTSTLAYYGEPLLGQSPGNAFIANGVIGVEIKGMPGEDILAPSDPTDHSYVFHGSWHLDHILFLLDDTVSNPQPHRWPGKWVDDAGMTASSAVFTSPHSMLSCGDVGQAIQVNGAGSGGANLVTTIASITPCWGSTASGAWPLTITLTAAASTTVSNAKAYISVDNLAATTTLGNCAIAFDNRDGNASDWVNQTGTTTNLRSSLNDVGFLTVSQNPQNNTCAIYSQQDWQLYGFDAENVYFGRTDFGVVQSTADTNPYDGGVTGDFQVWDHLYFDIVNHPWISYDGQSLKFENVELYSEYGPDILQVATQDDRAAQSWEINVPEFEGNTASTAFRVTGNRQHIYNTELGGGLGAVYLDTTNLLCEICWFGDSNYINGSRNKIIQATPAQPVADFTNGGRNNIITADSISPQINSVPLSGDYPVFPQKGDGLLGEWKADFLASGNASTPWTNNNDLWIWPQDVLPNGGTIGPPYFQYNNYVIPDSASISGYDYVFSAGAYEAAFSQFSADMPNGNSTATMVVGANVPATKTTVYLSAKCGSSTTFSFKIEASTGATVGSNTFSCTTAFQTYSLPADLTSYSGDYIFFTNNGSVVYNAAWIAVVPYQGNINSTGIVNAAGFDVAGSALATGNLADWTNTSIASGDIPVWNSGTSKWTATAFPQTGLTGSIGGSALTAGQCASGTATLGTSATGHTGTAAPSDGSNIQSTGGGLYTSPQVTVSGTTATVELCDIIAGTPTAKTYNVSVF